MCTALRNRWGDAGARTSRKAEGSIVPQVHPSGVGAYVVEFVRDGALTFERIIILAFGTCGLASGS